MADLLNLTASLDIVKKLEFDTKLDGEDKKTAQNRLLNGESYDEQEAALEECKSKELLWFYTGQEPFCSCLGAMGLSPLVGCRFCAADFESRAHLMYECLRFEHNETELLFLKARSICIEIYKLDE